ncbi:MAG: integrase arm-type DNA-binding domain-containing protein [Rhodobacter sp.]|nr:integrase arm-type DNA-binding domain-containing protein [Rhodobacter sp.]
MRITKQEIDALPAPESGDVVLWDDDLKGFGLRLSPGGARAFVIQYRNAQGRSRRLTLGRYGKLTPTEARDRAKKLFAKIELGDDPATEKAEARTAATMKDLCDDYLEAMEKGHLLTRRGRPKSESTAYIDRGRILRHIVPLLGSKLVKDVTRQDVEKFRVQVRDGKTAADVKTGPRGRAIVEGGAGTATRTLGLLGAIFAFAVERGDRTDNPVHGVRRDADKKRDVLLTPAQYKALAKALEAAEAKGEAWQAIESIRLLALTGCRRGEVEGLRWSEVDLAGSCLRLKATKTGESLRPLGADAVKLLAALPHPDDAVFVFPAIRNEDGPFGGLPKAWLRIAAGRALAGITPHGLRHSFAGVADELGYTLPTIGGLLGHASGGGSVTGRYIKKADAALIGAADAVSARIVEMMGRGQ